MNPETEYQNQVRQVASCSFLPCTVQCRSVLFFSYPDQTSSLNHKPHQLHTHLHAHTHTQARRDELGVLRAENTALKSSVSTLSAQLEEQHQQGRRGEGGEPGSTPMEVVDGGHRNDGAASCSGAGGEQGQGSSDREGRGVLSGAGGLAAAAAKDAEIAVLRHKVGTFTVVGGVRHPLWISLTE